MSPQWVKTNEPDGLCRVAYDPETFELWVDFALGSTWRLQGVPRRLYSNLMAVQNKRRHFANHLAQRFQCERVRGGG